MPKFILQTTLTLPQFLATLAFFLRHWIVINYIVCLSSVKIVTLIVKILNLNPNTSVKCKHVHDLPVFYEWLL
jgi:hypothetical protein